ncbi:phage tail spike protein [Clostridium perfringens]|nr:phage tail spike protein [Clostridium perfringens]
MKKELYIHVGKDKSFQLKRELYLEVKNKVFARVYVQVEDKNRIDKNIIVYPSTEIKFVSNGLAILDNVIRCEVEEVMNGKYTLELEYPIEDQKSIYLKENNIIKASTPSGEQPFRIYRVLDNLDTVIVYAKHIFFDLENNFLEDCRPVRCTCHQALQNILKNTNYKTNFYASSSIEDKASAYYIRKNPVEAMLTLDNSIVSMYKAELLRSNFNIFFAKNIGRDKGVKIQYAKNLLGFEEDIDLTGVVTRIMPTGLTEKDVSLLLDELYVDSPLINNYPFPRIKEVHFSDLKVDESKDITENKVKELLRERAKNMFVIDHIDLPKINYKVNFLDLRNTEEYKNFLPLQSVKLGDIVTVEIPYTDTQIKREVIRYKWNSIIDEFIEIELGELEDTITGNINNISSQISSIKSSAEITLQKVQETTNRVSTLEETSLADVKETLHKVEEVVMENKTGLKFADKDIKFNKEKISENTKNIEKLKDTVNSIGNNSIIEDNTKNINENKKAIQTNNKNILDIIAKLEERIKSLESKTTDKGGNV